MSAPAVQELSAIPILASLSRRELAGAARRFRIRTFPRDAIVATEGDRQDLFNVILSGHVQAFWRDEAGHLLKLGIDGPGDHFADVTLGGEPALASFIAIEDVRVASIRMIDLKHLMRAHPDITLVLLMDVVARLRRMVSRSKTLTMENVYGRVAKVLVASSVEVDGKRVCENLTHAEIGQRVGATREMVGRILRELARGGYIKAGRGRITILRKIPARW